MEKQTVIMLGITVTALKYASLGIAVTALHDASS
jgi:hypothetical protein